MCPSPSGGNNYWPSAYSRMTGLIYIPALTACAEVTEDPKLSVTIEDPSGQTAMRGGTSKAIERYETDLIAMDPLTGTVRVKAHNPYPNYSGALATAGGLVFVGQNQKFEAYDAASGKLLWSSPQLVAGASAPSVTCPSQQMPMVG